MIRLRRSIGSVESRRRMIALGETRGPIRTARRARQIRDGLRDLYPVIKHSDAHIRFAFLTGSARVRCGHAARGQRSEVRGHSGQGSCNHADA
jgi:hypothetical protein